MCERYINWLPVTQPQPGTWPATQACALIGNQTGNPLLCRPVPNPQGHTSQGYRLFLKRVFLVKSEISLSSAFEQSMVPLRKSFLSELVWEDAMSPWYTSVSFLHPRRYSVPTLLQTLFEGQWVNDDRNMILVLQSLRFIREADVQ